MLNDLLDQLDSYDPGERKQAVIALGKSLDPAALPALKEVYDTDPDPEVRELALKAGRHIRKNAGATPTSSGGVLAASPPAEAAAVRPADRERAQSYLDQALELSVRGNNAKAVEYLGRAFDFNPTLKNDEMAAGLAEDLSGHSGVIATRAIADPDERADLIRALGGRAGGGTSSRGGAPVEGTWGDAAIDVAIYGLVNAAVVFVGLVLLFQVFNVGMAEAGMSGAVIPGMQTLGIAGSGLFGLASGVGAIINLIFLNLAIHVVATNILGGAGTLLGLFRRTTLFYTIMIPIFVVVYVASIGLSLVSDAFVFLGALGALALVIGYLFYASKYIGQAYDFGSGKGCLSLFLGSLLLGVIAACCQLTLGAALGGMVNAGM